METFAMNQALRIFLLLSPVILVAFSGTMATSAIDGYTRFHPENQLCPGWTVC